MDRTHVIVIAIVVAALGLFGLRWLSQPTAVGSLPGRDSHAGGWTADEQGIADGRGVAGGRRGEPGLGAQGAPGSRQVAAAKPGEKGYQSRPGSAEAYSVGGSRRGGFVGRSGSTHSGGAGTSVSLRPNEPDLTSPQNSRRREELVEFLSTQSQADEAGREAAGDEPDGEVLLSLPLDTSVEAEDSTQPQAAQSVDVSDEGVGIEFGEDAVLAFPDAGNVRGDAGSISFEIEPKWAGGDETNNALVRIQHNNQFENRMELVKNGRYLRFIFTDNTGREADISVPIDVWTPGERHTITATWGEALTSLYIDGKLAGQNTYQGELLIPPSTPMYIGSAGGNYRGASAVLQNFKVYGRPLGSDEVASIY